MTQFSIIITSYNQKHFIKNAIDSALSQNCASKEVIVVDDASTDGTAKVLEKYGDKIHLIKLENNIGPSRARNVGANAANGDFLVTLDGDDLFLPWALDVYARIIDLKKPKIILCKLLFFEDEAIPTPKFSKFGEGLQVVEYDALIRKDRSYRGSGSAIVLNRQVFNEVGGYTDGLFPSETDDMQMKLGYSGRTVHILSHPTTAYRVHANQTMRQVYRFIDKMHLVINKEKNGEYPGGRRCKYERYAYIGGPICYWFKAAIRARLYRRAVKLMANGWLMALVGIVSRLIIKIKGGHPVETLTI